MQRNDAEVATGSKRKREETPSEASQAEAVRETRQDRKRRKNREYAKKARTLRKEYVSSLEDKLVEQTSTIHELSTTVSEQEQLIATLTAQLATATETIRQLQEQPAPIPQNPNPVFSSLDTVRGFLSLTLLPPPPVSSPPVDPFEFDSLKVEDQEWSPFYNNSLF